MGRGRSTLHLRAVTGYDVPILAKQMYPFPQAGKLVGRVDGRCFDLVNGLKVNHKQFIARISSTAVWLETLTARRVFIYLFGSRDEQSAKRSSNLRRSRGWCESGRARRFRGWRGLTAALARCD